MSSWTTSLNTSTLINCNIDDNRTLVHFGNHLPCNKLWCFGSRNENSANNKVTPPGGVFPKKGYVLSHDWDGSNMGYRSRRITELIEELSTLGDAIIDEGADAGKTARKLNISGMRSIQLDYTSGLWIDFHP